LLDGQPAEFASPRDALAAAISAVHQERNLIPRFSVGENIVLEHLPTRNGMVDYAEVHRQARAYLDLLDRAIDTRAEVATLSARRAALQEIAGRFTQDQLLLLDEPTAPPMKRPRWAARLRAQGVPSSR
jgi:ribose transport system ATP-binding protein